MSPVFFFANNVKNWGSHSHNDQCREGYTRGIIPRKYSCCLLFYHTILISCQKRFRMGNSIHDRDPFLKDRCRRLYKAIYFFFNQALILVLFFIMTIWMRSMNALLNVGIWYEDSIASKSSASWRYPTGLGLRLFQPHYEPFPLKTCHHSRTLV
jgi:hypothetical protein